MSVCKMLCFTFRSMERQVKELPNYLYTKGYGMPLISDFPGIEEELNQYIGKGYTVKSIAMVADNKLLVYLEHSG